MTNGPQGLDEYAAQALSIRLTTTLDHASRLLGEDPGGAVKAVRVAGRRLRAALDAFEQCYPGPIYNSIAREAKRLADAAGLVRDIDVMAVRLEDAAEQLPADQRVGLLAAAQELRHSRDKHMRQLCKRARQALELGLPGRLVWALDRNGAPPMDGSEELRALAAEAISRLALEMQSADPALAAEVNAERLHDLRIAAKRLRYTVELFAPLSAQGFKPIIDPLKLLQTSLGELHDMDVMLPLLQQRLAGNLHSVGHNGQPGQEDFRNIAGIAIYCEQALSTRGTLFAEFEKVWAGLREQGWFDSLWVAARRIAVEPEPVQARSE